MKKTTCIAWWGMLAAVPLFAGSITVIQPNGGEEAVLGGKLAIRWNAVNVSQNMRINLVKGSEVVGTIANDLPAGSAHYLWDVGQLTSGAAPAGGDYLIRIRAIDSTEVDQSDQFFSIVKAPMPKPHVPGPRLKMESPNGGEGWHSHSEYEIKWSSQFMTGKVRLQLMREGCCTEGIIGENLPATGSLSWKAGEYPGHQAPAGKYRVRVSSMNNPDIFDESDGPFDLKPRLADVFKDKPVISTDITLPGIYLNFPGEDCFPGYARSQIPASVFQEAAAAFNSAACRVAGVNTTAIAGIHWVTLSDPRFAAAAVYRSRIHFDLGPYAGQGGHVASARLKLKRIHAIDQDANCSTPCACAESVAVLKAAMTSFDIPGSIGQHFSLPLGQAEFTLDVTDIVKGWLDGTLANHGLLLWTNEGPCSNCDRLCISCYEVSLVLKLD